MTDPLSLIRKYYPEDNELRRILLTHSESVARKALDVAERHPELALDRTFLHDAALLHDVGIFLTDAPGIHCHGTEPYLMHGYLGAQLMRREGLPAIARVCERHTGTGLTAAAIAQQGLPLPPGRLHSRDARGAGGLLCRQVLLENAPRPRTHCRPGVPQSGALRPGWRGALSPVAGAFRLSLFP